MRSRKTSKLFIPVLGAIANLAIDLAVDRADLQPKHANAVRVISKAAVLMLLGLTFGSESPDAPVTRFPAED